MSDNLQPPARNDDHPGGMSYKTPPPPDTTIMQREDPAANRSLNIMIVCLVVICIIWLILELLAEYA